MCTFARSAELHRSSSAERSFSQRLQHISSAGGGLCLMDACLHPSPSMQNEISNRRCIDACSQPALMLDPARKMFGPSRRTWIREPDGL